MKLMSLSVVAPVFFLLVTAAHAKVEGGELGNAFVPFDSKIGHYSLEYSKDWRLNDLSETTSFADTKPATAAESFFSVQLDSAGAQSIPELAARLKAARPGVSWTNVNVSGHPALAGVDKGVRMFYLLRAPGDQITLRLHSADGERSEEILTHMLGTFRAE